MRSILFFCLVYVLATGVATAQEAPELPQVLKVSERVMAARLLTTVTPKSLTMPKCSNRMVTLDVVIGEDGKVRRRVAPVPVTLSNHGEGAPGPSPLGTGAPRCQPETGWVALPLPSRRCQPVLAFVLCAPKLRLSRTAWKSPTPTYWANYNPNNQVIASDTMAAGRFTTRRAM